MSSDTISVLIAEDEAVTRLGMKFALKTFPDVELVAESADGVSAILQALVAKPSIILMDIGLPKVDGITAARKVKEALPKTKVIVFTGAEDVDLMDSAFKAGVDGYCLKKMSGEDLYSAIKLVNAGEKYIARELRSTSKEPERTPSKREALAGELLKEQMASGSQNTIIGERYQVEKVLGRGGMGIVYKGRHIFMNRPVAIKILHPELAADAAVVARFRHEASTLSQFNHPNLISVFDFGVTKLGEPFMVMDFCQGKSLENLISIRGKLKATDCIPLFLQACEALKMVHQAGILHRDLKPGNLILTDEGHLKVVDFGLCKSFDGMERLVKLTCTGEVVGSPSYMSPEQCMGKSLDERSDIYSLGISMYETLTGELPFQADSYYEILNMHIRGTAPREPLLMACVPPVMEEIVYKCIDKDPYARYQTADELSQALVKASVYLEQKV
jgi:DNA-binding NarL/FixJ family response regulator/tRNA A-37 threonylcarbamoyl transferase component Bud32